MPPIPRPMSPGSSLLALLAVLALILAPAVAIIWPAYTLSQRDRAELDAKHPRDTRCMRGYLFEVGEDGRARQLFDHEGHGVPCEVTR